jgi:hypothetical protein
MPNSSRAAVHSSSLSVPAVLSFDDCSSALLLGYGSVNNEMLVHRTRSLQIGITQGGLQMGGRNPPAGLLGPSSSLLTKFSPGCSCLAFRVEPSGSSFAQSESSESQRQGAGRSRSDKSLFSLSLTSLLCTPALLHPRWQAAATLSQLLLLLFNPLFHTHSSSLPSSTPAIISILVDIDSPLLSSHPP